MAENQFEIIFCTTFVGIFTLLDQKQVLMLSHRFSILGSNVTPKGPSDGHDLPLAMKWASFVGMGLLVQIFASWQRSCIYPCVPTCAFVLQPNYFLKNHATLEGHPLFPIIHFSL